MKGGLAVGDNCPLVHTLQLFVDAATVSLVAGKALVPVLQWRRLLEIW